MQKVLLYIATSLDGFIARRNDDVSWLDSYQLEGEDYGYSAFIKTVGSAIMGSRTYQQSLEHPERLLRGLKTYVLSQRQLPSAPDVNVELYSGRLEALIGKIKSETEKDIFVVGGGKVVSSFINANLLDEIRQFVVPIFLGEGVSLYSAVNIEVKLKLLEAVSYNSGVVQLHYSLKPHN